MKRKFINGILMLSLAVTAVGSFVSCKDYDEDIYVDLRGRLANEASLREALNTQIAALQAADQNLQQQINNIKSCNCDLSKFLTQADLAGLAKQSDLNDVVAHVAALETTKQAMENQIAAIQAELQRLDQQKADQGDITRLDQLIAQTQAAATAAQTTAQQALDKATEALAAAQQGTATPYDDTELRTLISNLTTVVNGLQTTVNDLKDRMQAVEGVAANALNAANAAQQKANNNANAISNMQNQLTALQTLVNNHINNGAIHGGGGGGSSTPYDDSEIRSQLTTLQTNITNLNTRIDSIRDNYATAEQVEAANALAQKANDAIASLRDSIADGNIVRLDQLQDSLANRVTADQLRDSLANRVTADQLRDSLMNYVTIGQLRDSLNKYVSKQEFQDSITWIRDSIENLTSRLDKVDTALRSLTEDWTNLITGITINQTECPVIGTYNLPLFGHSTMLIGYYGQTTRAITFPEEGEDGGAYIDNEERLTDAELNFLAAAGYNWSDAIDLQAGEIYPNETQGGIKAGKVYFTVNPDNVDFEGQQLKIVNSQNVEAPVELSAMKHSSKVLQFAFDRTRAANNSFYEAEVTIPQSKLNSAILNVKEDELIEQAKKSLNDLKARKYGQSVSGMLSAAVTFFSAFDHTLDAYALKASWQDKTLNTERSVYSQYDIATAALKPLSFNMLQSLKGRGENFGLARIQSIMGRVKDRIVATINANFHINTNKDQIIFKDFNYTDAQMQKFYFKFETESELINIDKNVIVPVKDAYGNEIGSGQYHFTYQYEIDAMSFERDLRSEIDGLLTYMNDAYGEDGQVSNAVMNLLDQIEDLNGMADRLGNQSYEKANTLLVKVYNNYINKATANAYRAFDVCLLGQNSEGDMALVSMAKEFPTKVSGTVSLIPTSYTLELFAPAFKKFIAITNVYTFDGTNYNVDPSATTLAASANQGKNMMKVIDGDDRVSFDGVVGKIYEISYCALDYKGYKTRKKFYVQFK